MSRCDKSGTASGCDFELCGAEQELSQAGQHRTMVAAAGTLEEELRAFFSASDAEFDAVAGYLEDIIMDDEFQLLQRNFMDKYYQEIEDTRRE